MQDRFSDEDRHARHLLYLSWLITPCTLPISSAEAKRSFSLMKRIKTCTRLTMCEEHFSDLAIIAMHYPERFEVDEICEAFVKANPRRLFQATLFD